MNKNQISNLARSTEGTHVRRWDLLERTLDYSRRIIRLYKRLEQSQIGRILGTQLLRSGTSIGANYHEAQGAQTKADFVAKISIAYKEVLETLYWLRLIKGEAHLEGIVLTGDLQETEELVKIFSSILLTSKKN